MSATNDTPLKRFTAFWFVLGAFLLFGIIALFLAPLANQAEVTAADEDGATRRLGVKDSVESDQAKYLVRVENGDKLQVPPAEAFSFVGAKLLSSKPKPFENDLFRDPNLSQPEAEAPAEEAEKAEAVPEPATPPTPPTAEASNQPVDSSAN